MRESRLLGFNQMTIMDFVPGRNKPVYTPPGGPPQGLSPSREIYAMMGEANIFKLCEAFYRELEQSDIRPLFPQDIVEASKKQALFLIGVLGGPPVYMETFGRPRMRARHLPFEIDEAARQTWLGCFRKVLEHPGRYAFPEEHLPVFLHWLDDFSAWMVNTP